MKTHISEDSSCIDSVKCISFPPYRTTTTYKAVFVSHPPCPFSQGKAAEAIHHQACVCQFVCLSLAVEL